MRRHAVLTTLLLFGSLASMAQDDRPLTMEAYCDLSKRLYALSELELKDRLAIAEQIPNDRKELMARFETTRARYQSLRFKLYSLFETSSGAFAAFSQQNREEFEQYLEQHASDRSEVERLKGAIQALADRIEAKLRPAGGTN